MNILKSRPLLLLIACLMSCFLQTTFSMEKIDLKIRQRISRIRLKRKVQRLKNKLQRENPLLKYPLKKTTCAPCPVCAPSNAHATTRESAGPLPLNKSNVDHALLIERINQSFLTRPNKNDFIF